MENSPLLSHLSSPIPISEIEFHPDDPHPQPWAHHHHPHTKSTLHRACTAPAVTILHSTAGAGAHPQDGPSASSPSSILKSAALLLLVYLSLGVLVYSLNPQGYSGVETHPAVDALYFCIVTLCTIGYGDITPLSRITKALSCAFVLVGFGIIDVLLSGAVSYVIDVQENLIMASARDGAGAVSYIFDAEKGRMRIRMKVGLAVGVVILCIGAGALALYYIEDLDWMDSFYLSVMSVTTVGYGDRAFKTLEGRVFASFWLLVSTLTVARAFLYLAEARIDKRHRRIAKWVLQRDLTVEDLFAADINHSGFIRDGPRAEWRRIQWMPYLLSLVGFYAGYSCKSEFVIYKLKEMGKIGEKDILQICNQFNKLDPNNTGKITLPDHCTAAADNLRNGQYPALDSNISVYRREGIVQSPFHVL